MRTLLLLIILTVIMLANTTYSQYRLVIKKLDNSTEYVWLNDIASIEFTNDPFVCGTNTVSYLGITYNTLEIGSQCWFKENLNVGTIIHITSGGTNSDGEQTDNGIIEKYCYDNIEANCTTHGGFYQWAEAMAYEDGASNTATNTFLDDKVQGICPAGWHVPTIAEFTTLKIVVGGSADAILATGTNSSGFSALFAGNVGGHASQYIDEEAYFQTSSSDPANNNPEAYGMWMGIYDDGIYFVELFKGNGKNVRCLKD